MPALERSSIGDTVITHDSSIIVAESIKNNIEKSTKLAEMPDTAYLVNSTDKFLHVNDSVFIKEVFFPYMGLYYDNSTEINQDFSLEGKAEYHFLPTEVYNKNKPSVSIIGKIVKINYTILLVRYYDIDAVRCYLMTFDKDFNINASVYFFAYDTADPDDVYKSKDKIYFSPFIQYNLHEDSLKIYTKGSIDINYLFKIQPDGRINLVYKEEL